MLLPLLGSCGVIPLPETTVPDFHFLYAVNDLRPAEVLYMADNQLDYLEIPPLPYRGITFDALLVSRGADPVVRLQVFASASRPQCPVVPSTVPDHGDALRCPGPAGGEALTEVALRPHEGTQVRLKGEQLDQSVRTGRLYLGIRVLEGAPQATDRVDVVQIRVQGRL
ncbi:hypothetical protein ACFSC4_07330 [Deinococcus malanensis]|uniref:hypothetical protein n=1 Tax=Deinococcus malanensis TaxID=1706855 RepID=UPI00363E1120